MALKASSFFPCCFFDPMTDILWDSRGASKDPTLGGWGFRRLIFFNFVVWVVFCLFLFGFGFWMSSLFPTDIRKVGLPFRLPHSTPDEGRKGAVEQDRGCLRKGCWRASLLQPGHPWGLEMLAQAPSEQHVLLVLWPRATSGFPALHYHVASGLRLISQTIALFCRWHPLTCFIYVFPTVSVWA